MSNADNLDGFIAQVEEENMIFERLEQNSHCEFISNILFYCGDSLSLRNSPVTPVKIDLLAK